ncbi:amino acid racemase [Mesorhizobium sp. M0578]|uniref:aspartate/glutamate racemase family protein n=1 Tax=unclassified Mesorhizobium TaxID=325217 RepID=UPI00333595FC
MTDVKPQPNPPSFELLGQRKPLGVVGGMGSLATANFLEVLARKSRVERDQDHIPFIALSLPDISDRSQAISIGSDAPLRQILERAHWLENVGCGAIAIPCNTAHCWASEIKQALSVRFINMIEIARRRINDSPGGGVDHLRSIVLGTSAVVQHALYVRPNENGFGTDFLHYIRDLQSETIKIIAEVKSGKITEAQASLTRVIRDARSIKPDIILLACSELSALSEHIAGDDDIIDPIDILADACIEWWNNNEHSVTLYSHSYRRV